MSHVVTIATKVHDPVAINSACQRLGLPAPLHGTAKLYSGEATGLIVQLPGWQYPTVIEPLSGVIHYDNYGERWGEQRQLDRFLQMYAVERCRLEARKKGHVVTEQTLDGGAVMLRITEGA